MAQEHDEQVSGPKGESEETRKRKGRLNMIAGTLTGKRSGEAEGEEGLSSPTRGEVVEMLMRDSEEAKVMPDPKPKTRKRAAAKKTAKKAKEEAEAPAAPAEEKKPTPSKKRAAREAEVKAGEEAETKAVEAANAAELEALPQIDVEDDAAAEAEGVPAVEEKPVKRTAKKRTTTRKRVPKAAAAAAAASAVAVEAGEGAAEAAGVAEEAPAPKETPAPTETQKAPEVKAADVPDPDKTVRVAREDLPVPEAATGLADEAAMDAFFAEDGEKAAQPEQAKQAELSEEAKMEEEARAAYESLERRQKARRRRRIFIILALLAALAAGAWYIMNNMMAPEEEAAPEISTGMVYRGEFIDKVASSGSTEPLDSVVVTPEIDGIITEVKVAEGNYVNEGDEVLVIKNDELDRTIEEAARQIQAADHAIAQAEANANAAYNAYTNAWNAANAAGDFENFDEAGLQAAYSAALGEVESATDAKATAQSAYDAAVTEGQKRSVKAPRSGSVIAVNAVVGGGVGSAAAGTTSSGPLVQIADLSQMKVTVQVNEVDVSNIRPGQRGTATFSALPGVSTGVIVERIATSSTGSEQGGGGVVTYAVDLLIPAPDPNLRPGMTANVEIITQDVADTLIIPAAALSDAGNGQMYVTVVRGETPEEYSYEDIDVEVIAKNSTEAAVKGSLLSGDLVLLGMGDTGVEDEAETSNVIVVGQ